MVTVQGPEPVIELITGAVVQLLFATEIYPGPLATLFWGGVHPAGISIVNCDPELNVLVAVKVKVRILPVLPAARLLGETVILPLPSAAVAMDGLADTGMAGKLAITIMAIKNAVPRKKNFL